MHSTLIRSKILVAKDLSGQDVPIDVARMCAESSVIHELMSEALERFFNNGGFPDYAVGISITVYDLNSAGTGITEIDFDLEKYSPDSATIIKRRQNHQ